MKKINIAHGAIPASEISLGCMRLTEVSKKEASNLIHSALEEGINFFDHADIYGNGQSEEIFSHVLATDTSIREKIFVQTKCGICNDYYDSSKKHILESVDGSLKRLGTDYIDILLLHRPDALADPQEIAEAFEILHNSGKVRYFGVSNHNPMQMELLSKFIECPLVINQLQLSVTNTGMIDSGLNVNTQTACAVDKDGSVLDYCRLKDITIQAWSPLQYGFFKGIFLNSDKFPELNQVINEIAEKNEVPPSAIAISWILRHPANIQPIIGTTKPARLKELCMASKVTLSRQEWYRLYIAAGNTLL